MPPQQRFSLFLTPCAADFRHLEAVIRDLCTGSSSPPFEPHVTVYSGRLTDPVLLKRAVTAAVAGMLPLRLKVTGIGFSMEYFRSLFVEFEESPALRGVHDRLKAGVGEDSGYVLVPHLSLQYCDNPLEVKEALARSIALDREEIHFDRVKAVSPENVQEGWRDIARWRTLFSVRLGGNDTCGQ